MDKKSLSERDICTKFITPALETAGWDRSTEFLEEVNLTSGRVVVRDNKTKRDEKAIRAPTCVNALPPRATETHCRGWPERWLALRLHEDDRL